MRGARPARARLPGKAPAVSQYLNDKNYHMIFILINVTEERGHVSAGTGQRMGRTDPRNCTRRAGVYRCVDRDMARDRSVRAAADLYDDMASPAAAFRSATFGACADRGHGAYRNEFEDAVTGEVVLRGVRKLVRGGGLEPPRP